MNNPLTLETLFSLKGKTALITGASSGLGVEFAKALAAAGADIALVARRADRLAQVAEEISNTGVKCLPVTADLTRTEDIDAALEAIDSHFGGVDILVNNAGLAIHTPVTRHSREQWDQALAINLTAVFELTQRVGKSMIHRKVEGRIINISSVMGSVGNSVFATVGYNAAKGAVNTLTQQLAVEWAQKGVTVNAIAPGWFHTEMNHDARYDDVHPKYKKIMEEKTPMGRLGNPGELSAALVFLASPQASYVTGVVLPVDGGWLAW